MRRPNPHLTEWEQALENARSFNTLLLQLRGFGIPIVITIMGGGVAFAGNIDVPSIPITYAHVILSLIAVSVFLVVFFIWRAMSKTPKTSLSRAEKCEGCVLIAVPLFSIGLTFAFRRHASIDPAFMMANPAVIAIVLFGLLLLLGLYGIDRCYYYRLLIGAVLHAETLEKKLGFSLTTAISNETPGDHSKTLITTMYWLPTFGALLAVVSLAYLRVWTGNTQSSSGASLIKCLMNALR